MLRLFSAARLVCILALPIPVLFGLDPHKTLTQYTRTVWTQAQGLPQDTVRAITQTRGGYLWLGTSEGLARFDGYEFTTYTKASGALPSNSVTQLCAGRNGTLWIGTSDGLARYSHGQFQTYSARDGMPAGTVTSLVEDSNGALWIVAGGVLSRFENGRFTTFAATTLAPVTSARTVYEYQGHLWVGGVEGLVEKDGATFRPVLRAADLEGIIPVCMLHDSAGLWVAGSKGVMLVRSGRVVRRFNKSDGLLDNSVLALAKDRSGNLWVGTEGGLNRLVNQAIVPASRDQNDHGRVWSLFEDREGDLWAGMHSSLQRFRDDRFITYGRPEGLPSDEPNTVHQDRRGRIWIGYRDSGLTEFRDGPQRTYTTQDGLPSNQINSIRDGADAGLLIGTAGGLSYFQRGHFRNYKVPDPVRRTAVYDAIEDSKGNLWVATASGVYELSGGNWIARVPEGATPANITVALLQSRTGDIWAGTLLNGLWQLTDARNPGAAPRLYTTRDHLGSNQIRSLYEDVDGTLWIGTFGGGLNTFRDGVFHRYTTADGLPSDNIAHIEDDQRGSLWLSTPRGISRVLKQQLRDLSAGKIHSLTPENFGIADGLRSAQCAPSFPASGGGMRSSDGRLWFPTGSGLATLDPSAEISNIPVASLTPITRIVEVSVGGHQVDARKATQLRPGFGQIQFRYAGIYLASPERVRYSYQLEGLDQDWTFGGERRTVSYNPLPHGRYRFRVRAMLPGGGSGESDFDFEVLPHFYETLLFRLLCGIILAGCIYAIYRLRLARIHSRFALIVEERTRMAREIHDTLAQGFVGICHQLDALSIKLNGDMGVAREHLDLARKMARHSLTEARRSVTELRATELDNLDLPSALADSARRCVAGSAVAVQLEIGEINQPLPADFELNLLRIAQEAVTNAMKHAKPRTIRVELKREQHCLRLGVTDDGQGFEPSGSFSITGGHFGIVGMRERAQRLGAKFDLISSPGFGTQVEVRIPLAS